MSYYVYPNSPREKQSIRSRSPGKISNSYKDTVQDRTDFRNKMRYELKAAAKETFVEQLGEMRRKNQLGNNVDNEKQFQLELEVQRLRLMVEDLKANQVNQPTDSATNPMETHWAAMQSNRFHTPGNLDMISSDVSSVNSLTRNANYMPPLTAQHSNNHKPNNGLFVLSCAPVSNFEDVVHGELSGDGGAFSTGEKKKQRSSSLTQQIHQFNELQSLFALPSYESELQHMYSLRQQQASRQQPHGLYHDMAEQRDGRLQSAIEKHRDRLAVSREQQHSRYSPRTPASPAPKATSQYFRSPRRPLVEPNRTGNNMQETTLSRKSASAPAAANSASDMNRLEGVVPQLDANSSLKEIIRSSMYEHTAAAQEQQQPSSPAQSPVRVQDLSVDEFKSITDKMKDDIQKLIEDTVKEEILAESRVRKYTKRAESATLATHTATLTQRIENKVGDKITALKNELASLRMTRLHLKPALKKDDQQPSGGGRKRDKFMARRPNRGGAMEDEEEDSLLDEDGDRPAGDANWFANNELGHSTSQPTSPANVERTGKDVAAPLAGGLDDVSRELLLSIEHILKRHMVGEARSPSPHLHTEGSLVSQLTDYGDGADGNHFHSPARTKAESFSSSIESGPGVIRNTHKTGVVRKVSIGLGELFTAKPTESSRPNHSAQQPSPSSQVHKRDEKAHNHTADEEGDAPLRQPIQQQVLPVVSGQSVATVNTKPSKAAPKIGVKGRTDSVSTINPQLELEIRTAEAEYRAMMTSLLSLVDLKTNIKKELKIWNTMFEKQNGRPANDGDKAKINDRFLAYKMVSAQVQDSKSQIKETEDKIKRLRDTQNVM